MYEIKEVYKELIEAELDTLRLHIPFSIAEIRKAYDNGDYVLNTLPIEKWNRAAGYSTGSDRFSYFMYDLVKKYSISGSMGSIVCVLKETARYIVELEKELNTNLGRYCHTEMELDSLKRDLMYSLLTVCESSTVRDYIKYYLTRNPLEFSSRFREILDYKIHHLRSGGVLPESIIERYKEADVVDAHRKGKRFLYIGPLVKDDNGDVIQPIQLVYKLRVHYNEENRIIDSIYFN